MNLEFPAGYEAVGVEHIGLAQKFTQKTGSFLSCEYAASTLLAWGEIYKISVRPCDDRLWLYSAVAGALYFPLGDKISFEELMAEAEAIRRSGFDVKIVNVPSAWAHTNAAKIACCGSFIPDADMSDYIYRAEALATLPGARYAAKRNLIHQFERENPNFKFVAFAPEPNLLSEIDAFLTKWRASADDTSGDLSEDLSALRRAFLLWDTGLYFGAQLRSSEGRLVALCVYGCPSNEMAMIHFEKALRDVTGASQMLNRETARLIVQRKMTWINREQDLGVLGLRRAKRSYHPELQLDTGKIVLMAAVGDSCAHLAQSPQV